VTLLIPLKEFVFPWEISDGEKRFPLPWVKGKLVTRVLVIVRSVPRGEGDSLVGEKAMKIKQEKK
jgi:hypothetical protein